MLTPVTEIESHQIHILFTRSFTSRFCHHQQTPSSSTNASTSKPKQKYSYNTNSLLVYTKKHIQCMIIFVFQEFRFIRFQILLDSRSDFVGNICFCLLSTVFFCTLHCPSALGEIFLTRLPRSWHTNRFDLHFRFCDYQVIDSSRQR